MHEPREVDDPGSDQLTPRAVEVAGDGVDDLLDPVGDGSVGPHVDAGRAVQRGAISLEVVVDETTQDVGRDARDVGGPFGRPGTRDLGHLVEAAHVLADQVVVDGIAAEDLVEEREVEERVGVRADEDVL